MSTATKERKNSWDSKEEKLVVETVLENTRTGVTLVETFKSLSKELGRTQAAINYHWTQNLRPQHSKQFQEAKAEAKSLKNESFEATAPVIEAKTVKVVKPAETPAKEEKKVVAKTRSEKKSSTEVSFESLVLNHFQEVEKLREELVQTKEENKALKVEMKELQKQVQDSKTASTPAADDSELTLLREENQKLREALEKFNNVFRINQDLIDNSRSSRMEQLTEVQNEAKADKVASGS